MPAAVVKGILLSIGIIAALGLAVLENPQIQEWLEDQRRRLRDLLNSIGEELDPQSRRAAEVFAYEGRTVVNDQGLRREAEGSVGAAAVATGRSMSNASTIRRIAIQGVTTPEEAEERRRKGREYLAQRNAQLIELQQRNEAPITDAPSSPTSFDALVDDKGRLKMPEAEPESVPTESVEPAPISVSDIVKQEMMEVARNFMQPLFASTSSGAGSRGWQSGSEIANPFGDEYALDRSITPKPPVPPKVELDRAPTPDIVIPTSATATERVSSSDVSVPGSFTSPRDEAPAVESNPTDLSFEEQMAIALSLSEQESTNSATVRQGQHDAHDAELRAAIAASLREMDVQQAMHAFAHADACTPQPMLSAPQPLVDLSPSTQPAISSRPSEWASVFDLQFSPTRDPRSMAPSEASDELYRITPQLTRARLATHDAQQATTPATVAPEASEAVPEPAAVADAMDASFYSAPSEVAAPSSTRSHTLNRETPHLIDVEEAAAPPEGVRTPTSRAVSSFGFATESDTESFASVRTPLTRALSRPQSEVSHVEILDAVDDSDVDMLSEEGDGIHTPDSWSEIESREGESEGEEDRSATMAL